MKAQVYQTVTRSRAGKDGNPGVSAFKSVVFKRSNEDTDAPVGGTYHSPVPPVGVMVFQEARKNCGCQQGYSQTLEAHRSRRMERIRRFITDEAPDVLCLQELSFPANLWIPKGYRRVGISVVSCGVVNDGFMMSDHLPLVVEIKRQT